MKTVQYFLLSDIYPDDDQRFDFLDLLTGDFVLDKCVIALAPLLLVKHRTAKHYELHEIFLKFLRSMAIDVNSSSVYENMYVDLTH